MDKCHSTLSNVQRSALQLLFLRKEKIVRFFPGSRVTCCTKPLLITDNAVWPMNTAFLAGRGNRLNDNVAVRGYQSSL